MSRRILYWDSSAVISLLVPDRHTQSARIHASTEDEHLLSSLAHAEVCAVISRLERSGVIDPKHAASAKDRFDRGSWTFARIVPSRRLVQRLASRWALRGADLWHLGAALTLQAQKPNVEILSFDQSLIEAARGENIGVN